MILDTSRSRIYFGEAPPPATDMFYKIHGIIMYITWSILTFIALVSGRYMKHLHKYRMIIHASTGTLIMTNTFIIAILALKTYDTGAELELGHYGVGIVVMIVSVLQFIGGIGVRQIHMIIKWNSKVAFTAKQGHRIFGLMIVFLSNFQVASGLINYESPVKNLIYGHFAVYVVLIIGIEILFKYR